MGRKKQEIKAVLHLPTSTKEIYQFEKKICDFYITQVEKRLQPYPKEQKLQFLQTIMDDFSLH